MNDYRKLLLILVFALIEFGCGVKGDPVPPEKAPELGRGQPGYQKAARGIRVRPESVGLAPTGGTYFNEDEDSTDDEDDVRTIRPKKNSAQEETR